MFPTLKVSISGLNPKATYFILMDFVLADNSRYKFNGKEWTTAGKAEPQMPCKFYIHPESPATGVEWMQNSISFQKVKLTNNTLDQNGHVGRMFRNFSNFHPKALGLCLIFRSF
jgi:hypothetical protein